MAFGYHISINDLWDKIAKLANAKSRVIYEPERSGDIRNSLANINKAKNLLGYNPLYNYKKGLAITYKWFIKNEDIINTTII